jgi:hypothetical protein
LAQSLVGYYSHSTAASESQAKENQRGKENQRETEVHEVIGPRGFLYFSMLKVCSIVPQRVTLHRHTAHRTAESNYTKIPYCNSPLIGITIRSTRARPQGCVQEIKNATPLCQSTPMHEHSVLVSTLCHGIGVLQRRCVAFLSLACFNIHHSVRLIEKRACFRNSSDCMESDQAETWSLNSKF